MSNDTGRQIAVNVAINAARDFTVGAINHGHLDPDNVNDVVQHFASLTVALVDVVTSTHDADEAESAVVTAFPGTIVQSAVVPFGPADQMPTAPQSPFPAQAPTPQGPAPIPGGVSNPVEALWQDLFANPGNWHDNRQGKQNPKAPDFKHKTQKEPGGKYSVSLWVSGRDTPAWVKQQLGA